MPLVVDSPLTLGVQQSLSPWNDPAGAWAALNAAYGAMFEQVYDLVADQGSPDEPASFAAGWSTLLNVQTCPTQFLPFLGMLVGVYVAPGTPDAQARAMISAEANFYRGTPASVIAAAQGQMSTGQTAILIERTAASGGLDPYHFILVVPTSANAAAITSAVNAVKPAGVQWTLVQTNGTTWSAETNTWNSDTLTYSQKG